MPENVWTNGATNGLWNDGDNWSLTTKPADGEDIVLNGTAIASITGGFESDASAPAVRSFHRHPNYTGGVGTSSDPLILATQLVDEPWNPQSNKGKVIVQGPGTFYYVNGRGGAAQVTDVMFIDTDTQDTAIEVNGIVDRLHLIKGRVTALSGFAPATITVANRSNPATDAHLTLQGTAFIGLIMQQGGTVINTGSAAISALVLSGGTFDHGISAGNMSTIYQTGGTCIHRAATTVSWASILGGTLDMSQDGRAKTISLLFVLPGAEFKQNANITITEGGTILPITDIIPRSF